MPDEFLAKEDPGTRIYFFPLGGFRAVLKVYSYDSIFVAVRARIFKSRARREYENLVAAEIRGVPVAEALAVGEVDAGPMRRASYLVTRFVEGATMLEAYRPRAPGAPHPGTVLRAVAELVRTAHRAGFFHGSLFPRNVLLAPAGPRLIDVPFARLFEGPVPLAHAADDLACLLRFRHPEWTPRLAARFLRQYLGRPPGKGWGEEGRELAEAVLASTADTRSVRRKLALRLFGR